MNVLKIPFVVFGCLFLSSVYAQINTEQAEMMVINSNCNNQTVTEALKHKIKRHSQRDLGWHTFENEGYIDVERTILVNKGKRIRYRWRVNADGNIQAVSKKAKKLCLP